MGYINNREIQYINNLINAGRESTILDFKEEWYKLEYTAQKYEFVKDCLSFLNVSIDIDRYIIIGVKENKEIGTFTKVGVSARPEENNIQEIITENIEPIPQIDIFTKVLIENLEFDLIKIRRENKDQPYLFRKDFKEKQKKDYQNGQMLEGFSKVCKGLGYIRHGSSSHLISRNELTNMFFKKQSNIYGYFNFNSDISNDYFGDIMSFLDCMNSLISKESLDTITNNNIFLKPKLFDSFDKLIRKGTLFSKNAERKESSEHICNMIIDNKDNFSKLKGVLDGGENSMIILIFCAAYSWYIICNSPKVSYDIINEVAIIKLDDEISDDEYGEIDKYVTNLSGIIDELEKISFYYNRSENVLKIKKIIYDIESSKHYLQSDIKFRVSEDVIPLLIEPLYKQSNGMEIALREMLQNSIDACKFINNDKYTGEIKIAINKDSLLTFEDNGIGMSLDDIREYYLTVGKSKKKTSDIPVVGRFGIGALSMFLVGKKAIVRTKKSDGNEYKFELFADNNRVSNLSQRIVNGDESYTKIEIELNKELKSSDIKGLITELGVDRWIVYKNNINIIFSFMNESYQVPSISLQKDRFKPILETDSFSVIMYDDEKANEINSNLENTNFEKIIKAKNVILYNDIMINAAYNFNYYTNLNKNNIPFIVIAGKTEDNEVSIELSRSSANIGGVITEAIVEKIYENEVGKIIDYLKENQNKSNSLTMKNEITQLVREHVKLPLILLSKNEIVLANSRMQEFYAKANKAVVIHSNSLTDECINFETNKYYIVESFYSDKSRIADLITTRKVMLITAKLLYKYIINATSSSNGFRMDALKLILKDLSPNVNWELTYYELWNKIQVSKSELSEMIQKKSVYGIYYFDISNKSLIESIFTEKIENRDLLVYVRDINNFSTYYSYDKKFDEIFLRAYSQK